FFFTPSRTPRDLPSVPTRRSSDLGAPRPRSGGERDGRPDHEGAQHGELQDVPRGGGARCARHGAVEVSGGGEQPVALLDGLRDGDRKSTRLNSSHVKISYAVFCLK